MSAKNTRQWLRFTIVLGGLTWLIAFAVYLVSPETLHEIELLFHLGVSLITPLAMRIVFQPNRDGKISRLNSIAIRFHPIVIIAVGLLLFLNTSVISVVLVSVWFLQTVFLAMCGLQRLLQRPAIAIEEICIDFGFLYTPISGIWFIAYSADYSLLTFDRLAMLLTAVHFVFISLGALVIIGLIGRQLYESRVWHIYKSLAIVSILSPLAIAIGITFTQFSGRLWLEAGAVVILASSYLLVALLYLLNQLPQDKFSKLLITLSTISLFGTMLLALGYSIGRLTNMWVISIPQMVQWHGWLNAVGFCLFGLLGWNVSIPNSKVALYGIPFSQMPWRWHIGTTFFERIGAIENNVLSSPTGIVDEMSLYKRDNFAPQNLDQNIIAFYEDTASHELLVYPEWKAPFKDLSKLYKLFSQRVEQMNFPLQPESEETLISSNIIPLKDELDGRDKVRGWVRVYPNTGQAVYVAAYSSHIYENCRYMNIAFPLPFGNLTSILRLELLQDDNQGVLLTSFSKRQQDQGVYFASSFLTIRLPIDETIKVYSTHSIYEDFPRDFAQGEIVAEHKMWLFGIHFLTLHYSISTKK